MTLDTIVLELYRAELDKKPHNIPEEILNEAYQKNEGLLIVNDRGDIALSGAGWRLAELCTC